MVAVASGKRLALYMSMRIAIAGLLAIGASAVCAPSVAAAQSLSGLPDSSLLVVPPVTLAPSPTPDRPLARIDSVVALARAQLGRRYRRGGESPSIGFDCSGLVQYVMHAFDVTLPRTAREQARAGLALPRDTSQLRPGDLLTFGKSARSVTHVGIYLGGNKMIAAPHTGEVVHVQPIYSSNISFGRP